MSDIVILGANGYLGRQLAHVLNQQGVAFLAADIHAKSVDGYINYMQVDVTNQTSIKQLPINISRLYIFAGITGTKTDEASRVLYTKVNELGLQYLLDYYKDNPVHVVFPSTRLVYKGVKDKYLSEEAEKEAKTIYAENKLNCEKLLKAQTNLNYTIFRICVPYGNLIDGQYSYGTIGFFLGKAANGEDITLFGNGEQKRTFTHVSDIVGSILATENLEIANRNTYNIGSKDAMSLKEVAQIIADKYGVSIKYIEWPEEALRIESGDTIFNDDKLITDTNYNYQFNLKSWVESIKI